MNDTLIQVSPFIIQIVDQSSKQIYNMWEHNGRFDILLDNDELLGYIYFKNGNNPNRKRYIIKTSQDAICLTLENGNELSCGIGAGCWLSSFVLSTWILHNNHIFDNKRVIELGSGIGLSGLVVASLWQKTVREIKLTDKYKSLCNLLKINTELNANTLTIIPRIQKFDWACCNKDNYTSYDGIQGEYDIIIASDCIYHNTKEIFKKVVLKNLRVGGIFVMANPPEISRSGIDDFIYSIGEYGEIEVKTTYIYLHTYKKEILIIIFKRI